MKGFVSTIDIRPHLYATRFHKSFTLTIIIETGGREEIGLALFRLEGKAAIVRDASFYVSGQILGIKYWV